MGWMGTRVYLGVQVNASGAAALLCGGAGGDRTGERGLDVCRSPDLLVSYRGSELGVMPLAAYGTGGPGRNVVQ